jgi:uncharacterized protein (TIGR02145 family)
MSSGDLSNWTLDAKSWFLGIGINEYQEFPNLSNAVKDVQNILDVLVSQYDVNPECVITLFDQEAHEENIIDKLDFLGNVLEEDDKLIIYYSGHGKLNTKLNLGYWIPHDGKAVSAARYILNSTIRDYIGAYKAKHILLVSDACFSGSIFISGSQRSTRAIDELDQIQSRWAICSGRHDEAVYDGDPGTNSPFARSLIDILNYNKRDYLNIADVANRVIEQTAANYEQLPEGRPMYGVGHDGGQYIFRRRGAEPVSKSQTNNSIDESTVKSNIKETSGGWRYTTKTSGDGFSIKSFFRYFLIAIVLILGTVFGVFYMVSRTGESTSDDGKISMISDSDNNTYPVTYKGDRIWMTQNMGLEIPGEKHSIYFNKNEELAQNKFIGRLYSYSAAMQACKDLGVGWRLPSLEDFTYLAKSLGYELQSDENSPSVFKADPDLAKALSLYGSSGLSFRLGGKYLVNSDKFVPASFEDVNSGHYWLDKMRVFSLMKSESKVRDSDPEYQMNITKKGVSWDHAYSCRCIKNN